MSMTDTFINNGCTQWLGLHSLPINNVRSITTLNTKDGEVFEANDGPFYIYTNSAFDTVGSIYSYRLRDGRYAGYYNGAAYINNILAPVSQSITISVWFMQTVTAATGAVNTIYDSSDTELSTFTRIRITSANSLSFSCKNGSTATLTTYDTKIVNNVWYHVVATHSTTETKLYINGELQTSGGPITLDLVNQIHNTIGCYAYAKTNLFTGCMKDFIMFNGVLSEAQIRKIYSLTYIQ